MCIYFPAVRKPRPVRPCSPITNPTFPLKKKSKEGKGKRDLGSVHGSKGEKVGNYRFCLPHVSWVRAVLAVPRLLNWWGALKVLRLWGN